MSEEMNLIDDGDLAELCEASYLIYAIMTVRDRALCHVQDGQKPVQKRVLYAMHEMGLFSEKNKTKSAKVVGTVIGNYHPHGDTAAYATSVRLAQPFSMRYPLIVGQGNFGSRDGDTPAAQRYTEMYLAPISELLLEELAKGSVPFKPNYDSSTVEPTVLPARLPFVLLNGSEGIAVGMTSHIPSHNLREVSAAAILMLQNPDCTIDDLMAVLPGPDYHGGARVISSPSAIRDLYLRGEGQLRIRAIYKIEELPRSQWQLIVTELPPAVSGKQILSDINNILNPEPKQKGGKLTQDQLNLRALAQSLIGEIRDESDRENPLRLVIEPKTAKVDRQILIQFLLAHTAMEVNESYFLNVLDLEGRPISLGLIDILKEWIAFRKACVTRRTQTRLSQVIHRLKILLGRQKVILDIDEAIAIIKKEEDPAPKLMAHFEIDAEQAEDILEMKLRQLSRLDNVKIEKEQKQLTKEQSELEKVLSSPKALVSQIVKEIEADTAKYGDDRRTLLEEDSVVKASTVAAAAILDDPLTVVLTQNGWLKAKAGHDVDPASFQLKQGDLPLFWANTSSAGNLLVADSGGKVYTIAASLIPTGRGDGVLLTSQIDLARGAKPVGLLSPDAMYVWGKDSGLGIAIQGKDCVGRLKSGKEILVMASDEKALAPVPVNGQSRIAMLSSKGKLLVFDASEVKEVKKGKGCIMMDLEDGAKVKELKAWEPDTPLTIGDTSVDLAVIKKYTRKRASKGSKL